MPRRLVPHRRLPLAILVGVTGVGKSTTVDALAEHFDFTLLPNRRTLTDQMIIAPMQTADGRTARAGHRSQPSLRLHAPLSGDRIRAAWPMRWPALLVDPEVHPGLLLFDGLRGVNEIEYAIEALAAGSLHRSGRAGRCARATPAGAQRFLRSG